MREALTEIRRKGVIEGQPEIRELKYSGRIKTPEQQLRLAHRSLIFIMAASTILLMCAGILLFWTRGRIKRNILIVLVSECIILVCMLLFMYFSSLNGPPFGFD
jgi:purine-cytosine permease-like protein